MNCYCVKYTQKNKTSHVQYTLTKNDKQMIKGKCVSCNIKISVNFYYQC